MGKNINDCPKGVRSVGEIGKGSGYYEVGRVKAVFFFLESTRTWKELWRGR